MNRVYRSAVGVYRNIYNRIFYFRNKARIYKEELNLWKTNFRPPGHYYSPFPDSVELGKKKDQIFQRDTETTLNGIDLRADAQYSLLQRLSVFYLPVFFPVQKTDDYRYYFDNQYFCYSDAIFLSCMIREMKPRQIIEIGSGFSSAVMLDVNERHFGNQIKLTFIEPYPEDRLNLLVKKSDNFTIIQDFVQNVSTELFEQLGRNDILFIDSSHISKTYSDVNHLVFNIIPLLQKGVIVHFHDIFFPFEYPAEWIINQQRGWNEAYLLRAFLQFNTDFQIELFTSFLEKKYTEWFKDHMPLCLTKHEKWPNPDGSFYYLETGGQSLYLRKI
jgi:predicted O-methyltransferase YrrM